MKYATIAHLLVLVCLAQVKAEEPKPSITKQVKPWRFQQGDRVAVVGNTFADQLRLNGDVETLLAARNPQQELRFRNLGWSGDTVSLQPRPLNHGALDDHLKQFQASVIIACFGMNESYDGESGLQKFTEDWQAFLQHIQSTSYNGKAPPRLVIVSPIAHEYLADSFPDPAAHNRQLSTYTAQLRQLSAQHGVTFIDLFTPTTQLYQESVTPRLTKNGIHLNSYGYWAVSQILADHLAPSPGWRVEIDAKMQAVSPEKETPISQLSGSNNSFTFSVHNSTLSLPPSPTGADIHASLAERLPQLTVKNLTPGTYQLSVGGRLLAKADAQTWAKGITLAGGTTPKESEELRKAVMEKSATFFHRWRAHNSEYIFGRRAKPFGVLSFPPEMEKFDAMLQYMEQNIDQLNTPPAAQTWEFKRTAD